MDDDVDVRGFNEKELKVLIAKHENITKQRIQESKTKMVVLGSSWLSLGIGIAFVAMFSTNPDAAAYFGGVGACVLGATTCNY